MCQKTPTLNNKCSNGVIKLFTRITLNLGYKDSLKVS